MVTNNQLIKLSRKAKYKKWTTKALMHPDLPGVKYKCIRGKYDFQAVANRKTSRSSYGVKLDRKK